MSSRIKIQSTKILSSDWGKLTKETFEFQTMTGEWQTHIREIFDHGDAAAVLLVDSVRDQIILIRQFRMPAFQVGDAGWMLETVAGLLDGDTPEICARKEAMEEAGIAPSALRFAFHAYMSPGFLTERLYCFVGEYQGPISQKTGGLEHEGEDIEIIEMPFETAFNMIKTGEIIDAKAIMLLQHLALERLSTSSPT